MRRLRYHVAVSLDGLIAGPNGEYDWITNDPSIDFGALLTEFDTLLMGRKTFELVQRHGLGPLRTMKVVVCSTTMQPADHANVRILDKDVPVSVAAMKREPGKAIWLFGGGALFRTLLDAGIVDTIEVALMPIIVGDGIPMVARGPRSPALRLTDSTTLPSGIVMLRYEL